MAPRRNILMMFLQATFHYYVICTLKWRQVTEISSGNRSGLVIVIINVCRWDDNDDDDDDDNDDGDGDEDVSNSVLLISIQFTRCRLNSDG